ncbi:MAG: FAD-binding protein [Candidatus Baldrarchaeia archaeon]
MVVWPETIEQISEIIKLANEIKIPVITLGGGAGGLRRNLTYTRRNSHRHEKDE